MASAFGDHAKNLLLPPPPLNRVGFRRSRKNSATTPPPLNRFDLALHTKGAAPLGKSWICDCDHSLHTYYETIVVLTFTLSCLPYIVTFILCFRASGTSCFRLRSSGAWLSMNRSVTLCNPRLICTHCVYTAEPQSGHKSTLRSCVSKFRHRASDYV